MPRSKDAPKKTKAKTGITDSKEKELPSGLPRGQPSLYSRAVVDQILEDIAEGVPVKAACRDWSIKASTFFGWVLDDTDNLSDRYARALSLLAMHDATEMRSIADDGSNDYMETRFGTAVDREVVARSKLRIEQRQWFAARALPEKFGGTGKNAGVNVQITFDGADKEALGL